MKKNKLISLQALEIAELREVNKAMDNVLHQIRLSIVCVSGPINDNKLKYTEDQQQIFHSIADGIETVVGR